mgnify:CR=1 FL=1
MRAGLMRHRIELQSSQEIRDPSGQGIPEGTTYATGWAELRPISGREMIAGRMEQAEQSVLWHIRYRSDVTVKHRVLFGARIFDINAVLDVGGRRRELDLVCTEQL